MKNILIVGSLNLDFLIEVREMPEKGETILGKEVTLNPGGKGANQAYAAGRLKGRAAMIGAVGADLYGEMLVKNLQNAGVDTTGIEVSAEDKSGSAFILLNEKGDNSIVVIPGANSRVTPAFIDRHTDLVDWCDIIIMQLEIPLDTIYYTKRLARQRGKTIIIDPAPARAELPDEFFRGIDLIKPNETELQILLGRKLTGRQDAAEGARELLEKGVGKVIITLGSEGCILVTREGSRHFEACKVETVDTTAAGDCFTAALAVALSEGAKVEEAILFGNKVSGIAVTRKGAQSSIPSREEIGMWGKSICPEKEEK